MKKQEKKYISKADALKKLEAYCAYQDRCHKEARTKLLDLGIYGDDLEDIMVDLIQDNFLNEERFARSYAGGKFRIKKWGRVRILRELKMRQISEYCIKKGMEEIEEDAYWNTLTELLQKKNKTLKEKNEYKRKNKLAQYVYRKGYESSLIWEAIGSIFNKKPAYSARLERKAIEESQRWEALMKLLRKKNKSLREPNDFKRKHKLARFAIGKGYESILTWKAVKMICNKE